MRGLLFILDGTSRLEKQLDKSKEGTDLVKTTIVLLCIYS